MSDKNLGWALKNGDLDRVKEIIEADVSVEHLDKIYQWDSVLIKNKHFFGKAES